MSLASCLAYSPPRTSASPGPVAGKRKSPSAASQRQQRSGAARAQRHDQDREQRDQEHENRSRDKSASPPAPAHRNSRRGGHQQGEGGYCRRAAATRTDKSLPARDRRQKKLQNRDHGQRRRHPPAARAAFPSERKRRRQARYREPCDGLHPACRVHDQRGERRREVDGVSAMLPAEILIAEPARPARARTGPAPAGCADRDSPRCPAPCDRTRGAR